VSMHEVRFPMWHAGLDYLGRRAACAISAQWDAKLKAR
jgi:hypothetical protein